MNISNDAKQLLTSACTNGGTIVNYTGWVGGICFDLCGDSWRKHDSPREEAQNEALIYELKKIVFIKSRSLNKYEKEIVCEDFGTVKVYQVTAKGYDYNDEINK